MINLHSQIVVTKKVIDEFGSHEISFLDENWEKGLSWYLSKMPIAEPDQLTVDFTPKYLFRHSGIRLFSLFEITNLIGF